MSNPLHGPNFGSYSADEVSWLLTDFSDLTLEADTVLRERQIQSGKAHYAESLPIEFQPDGAYQDLFEVVLAQTAPRLAVSVGVVTELVLAERGHDIALASLARAGTPIGILMRRWAQQCHGLQLPHYAVSIVRDRGIDSAALQHLAENHAPSTVVFVDGWTGKGAITQELTEALDEYADRTGVRFNPDLAVLADPGHCVRTFGTRDDFLIASACLNSTVSGLISRTVLNPALMRPGDFHGAKFYRELGHADRSAAFLDAVTARFDEVRSEVDSQLEALRGADREPSWSGLQTVRKIQQEYGIATSNFVKPGIGETTRVLLRRLPWKIVLRDPDAAEHRHIRMLAEARGVPIDYDPDLAYACVGLVKDVAS
ncbi:Citrate lyase beta subunit [Mycobacteroides abscessus subsp. abscessus]|uniref:cysteine protease StiP family protein n=1 Tax=Mycobacteroides abscessus TaxID=36809 RepID=UPI0009265E73|nr:cysteine protease StiP family protein [Mycobacteroides abscessus]SIH20332.1 Citrate lyase beta subunit [Mycobacteroides abscessus subsp. abscessus]